MDNSYNGIKKELSESFEKSFGEHFKVLLKIYDITAKTGGELAEMFTKLHKYPSDRITLIKDELALRVFLPYFHMVYKRKKDTDEFAEKAIKEVYLDFIEEYFDKIISKPFKYSHLLYVEDDVNNLEQYKQRLKNSNNGIMSMAMNVYKIFQYQNKTDDPFCVAAEGIVKAYDKLIETSCELYQTLYAAFIFGNELDDNAKQVANKEVRDFLICTEMTFGDEVIIDFLRNKNQESVDKYFDDLKNFIDDVKINYFKQTV